MTGRSLSAPSSKIHFLDNLKVFLIVLVVVHHAVVTYGGPGGWYYSEKTLKMGPLIAMNMIAATDQAFFMGFFFFIAAFFTEPSYDKKGPLLYLRERLIRLGIPLLFYSFVLSPFLSYLVDYFGNENHQSYGNYLRRYDHWINFGVLWFVAALLFFTMVFAIVKLTSPPVMREQRRTFPVTSRVLLFSVILALVSFVVRIFYPVGWTLQPLGWQLGHFPQYIALFAVGIIAARSRWLELVSPETGRRFFWLPLIMILIGFPLLYVVKEVTHSGFDSFVGGLNWQSLLFCLWEQITGIFLIVVLIKLGKLKWNTTSPRLAFLSRAAFGTYIFHPLLLIGCSLALRTSPIDPAWKLVIVAPAAIVLTFLFVRVVLMIPGVGRVI